MKKTCFNCIHHDAYKNIHYCELDDDDLVPFTVENNNFDACEKWEKKEYD